MYSVQTLYSSSTPIFFVCNSVFSVMCPPVCDCLYLGPSDVPTRYVLTPDGSFTKRLFMFRKKNNSNSNNNSNRDLDLIILLIAVLRLVLQFLLCMYVSVCFLLSVFFCPCIVMSVIPGLPLGPLNPLKSLF